MRKLSILSAAVAGVLAGAAANAATVDMYATGASAQRSFWKTDLLASFCGASGKILTFQITGASANPDNEAYRCTAASTTDAVTLPTGVSAGDVITLRYSAELGSVWGIAPFIPGGSTNRLYVNPDSGDCGLFSTSATEDIYHCTIGNYDAHAEAFTAPTGSTFGDALVLHNGDVGLMDLEPTKWANSDNWPEQNGTAPYSAIGPVPPLSDLQTLQASTNAGPVNGQLFAVIVNTQGPLATAAGTNPANLSKESLSAIFTGQYTRWNQVPEVGGGTTSNTGFIHVCRRDHGSGTQVAASVFFTQKECASLLNAANLGTARFVAETPANGNAKSLGALSGTGCPVHTDVNGATSAACVQENNTTGKLRTCVQSDPNAIGFASVSINAGWKTISIDGVQPNAHNAAANFYPYAFEAWAYNNSAASGASTAAQNTIALLISDAKAAAKLPAKETGNPLAAGSPNGPIGTWDNLTSPKSNFALSGGTFGTTFRNATSWKTTSQAVSSLHNFTGEACKVILNPNGA